MQPLPPPPSSAPQVSPLANAVVPPGAEPSRTVIMAGVAAVGLMPLSLAVTVTKDSAGASLASVSFVLLFCAAIGGHLLLPPVAAPPPPFMAPPPPAFLLSAAGGGGLSPSGRLFGAPPLPPSAASASPYASPFHIPHTSLSWGGLSMVRMSGLLLSYPVLCFAFTSHDAIFPTLEAMQSVRRVDMACRLATIGCFLIYLAAGALGYAAFKVGALKEGRGARLGQQLLSVYL